jgi:hypothetical protein
MPRIFINYRRVDSAGFAGRLYDHLYRHLGADSIFMDIDSIAPGEDFVQVIQRALDHCDAVLVMIGPTWATATDEHGQRRLDIARDYVRMEIEEALKRDDVRVIPVLVNGATMPDPDDLPDGLKPLTRRNAVELTNARFAYDVERLAQTLQTDIPDDSDATSKPRPWLLLNMLLVEWIALAIYIERDEILNGEPLSMNGLTWMVLTPIAFIVLAVLWPINPLVAGVWVFVLHAAHITIIQAITASSDTGNPANTAGFVVLIGVSAGLGVMIGGLSAWRRWLDRRRANKRL